MAYLKGLVSTTSSTTGWKILYNTELVYSASKEHKEKLRDLPPVSNTDGFGKFRY